MAVRGLIVYSDAEKHIKDNMYSDAEKHIRDNM